jgi:hypothetical protein
MCKGSVYGGSERRSEEGKPLVVGLEKDPKPLVSGPIRAPFLTLAIRVLLVLVDACGL